VLLTGVGPASLSLASSFKRGANILSNAVLGNSALDDGGQLGEIDGSSLGLSACEECEIKPAMVQCDECQQRLCPDCSKLLHRAGTRKSHFVHVRPEARCQDCLEQTADLSCSICQQILCQSCSYEIHRTSPELKQHPLTPLL